MSIFAEKSKAVREEKFKMNPVSSAKHKKARERENDEILKCENSLKIFSFFFFSQRA